MIKAKNGDVVRFIVNRVNYQGTVFYIDRSNPDDTVYLHIVVPGCLTIFHLPEPLTVPVASVS